MRCINVCNNVRTIFLITLWFRIYLRTHSRGFVCVCVVYLRCTIYMYEICECDNHGRMVKRCEHDDGDAPPPVA